MCYNCYHRKGREKKAWLCSHKNKNHYARGYCNNCYHLEYKQVNPEAIKNASKNARNKKKIKFEQNDLNDKKTGIKEDH
jgi:hypothetical protein